MHQKSLDVCIEILREVQLSTDQVKYYIAYWNLGCMGKPFLIDTEEYIMINEGERPLSWVELDIETMTQRRYRSGIPGATND